MDKEHYSWLPSRNKKTGLTCLALVWQFFNFPLLSFMHSHWLIWFKRLVRVCRVSGTPSWRVWTETCRQQTDSSQEWRAPTVWALKLHSLMDGVGSEFTLCLVTVSPLWSSLGQKCVLLLIKNHSLVPHQVVVLKECDSGWLPGSGSEAAAGPHQTLWMTAVTRPRGRAAGQSGQFTFNLTVTVSHYFLGKTFFNFSLTLRHHITFCVD